MRPDPEGRPTVVDAGGGDGMDDGVALEAGEGARRPGTQNWPTDEDRNFGGDWHPIFLNRVSFLPEILSLLDLGHGQGSGGVEDLHKKRMKIHDDVRATMGAMIFGIAI